MVPCPDQGSHEPQGSEGERDAQAMRIAGLFADPSKYIHKCSYMTPTDRSILRHELAQPTGATGLSPNGISYEVCKITDAGLFALEMFLANRRWSKLEAGRAALELDKGDGK